MPVTKSIIVGVSLCNAWLMKPTFTADVIACLTVLPFLLFGYAAFANASFPALFYAALIPASPKIGAAITAFLIPTLEAVAVLLLLFCRTRLGVLYLGAVYPLYEFFLLPRLPCSGCVNGRMCWNRRLFLRCGSSTFCLETKSGKKVKDGAITPRARPGQGTGVRDWQFGI